MGLVSRPWTPCRQAFLGRMPTDRTAEGNSTWSTVPLFPRLTHFPFLAGELSQSSREIQREASESECLVQTLAPSLGKSPSLSKPCFHICKTGMLTAPISHGGGGRVGGLRQNHTAAAVVRAGALNAGLPRLGPRNTFLESLRFGFYLRTASEEQSDSWFPHIFL